MCLLPDCRLSLMLQLQLQLQLLFTLKLMQEEMDLLALTCYGMKRDAESKRRPHAGKSSRHVLDVSRLGAVSKHRHKPPKYCAMS